MNSRAAATAHRLVAASLEPLVSCVIARRFRQNRTKRQRADHGLIAFVPETLQVSFFPTNYLGGKPPRSRVPAGLCGLQLVCPPLLSVPFRLLLPQSLHTGCSAQYWVFWYLLLTLVCLDDGR